MKVTNKNYYMERFLVDELEHLKRAVACKWDAVILIDGVEGSGKDTIGDQVAYYLDPTYNLSNKVFTPEQFEKAVDKASKGQAVYWCEFGLGGLATDAMTTVQGMILKKLTTIRSKGLVIILAMSWIFELRKYFAIGRTRFLLHTTTPDGIERGFFKFYGFDNKRQLYIAGKKNYTYHGATYNKRGRFPNTEGLFYDQEEYEVKKQEAIKSICLTKKGHKVEKWKVQRDKAIIALLKYETQKEVASKTGLSQQVVCSINLTTQDKDSLMVEL